MAFANMSPESLFTSAIALEDPSRPPAQCTRVTTPAATARRDHFLGQNTERTELARGLPNGANPLGGWPSTAAGSGRPERDQALADVGCEPRQDTLRAGSSVVRSCLLPHEQAAPRSHGGLPGAAEGGVLTAGLPAHACDREFHSALILVCWFHFRIFMP